MFFRDRLEGRDLRVAHDLSLADLEVPSSATGRISLGIPVEATIIRKVANSAARDRRVARTMTTYLEGYAGHRGGEVSHVDVGQYARGDGGADVVAQGQRQHPHVGLVGRVTYGGEVSAR